MLNQPTIEKLHTMKLHGMADAFRAQIETADASQLGFDRKLLRTLSASEWVRQNQNVLLIGPTGIGKSWLACALAHKACRDGFSVTHKRTAELFRELAVAHVDGSIGRLLLKFVADRRAGARRLCHGSVERQRTPGLSGDLRRPGVGIEAETLDKLFEAFYTSKSFGMGIGLSVSRSIIENHHGRLWAAANADPGATFSFSIPQELRALTSADSLSAIRAYARTDAEVVAKESMLAIASPVSVVQDDES